VNLIAASKVAAASDEFANMLADRYLLKFLSDFRRKLVNGRQGVLSEHEPGWFGVSQRLPCCF
jgi:hypothetical protein